MELPPTPPAKVKSIDQLVDNLGRDSSWRQLVQELLSGSAPLLEKQTQFRSNEPAPSLPARYRFATALRALRELRGVSQSELARLASLTSGYVSKLESGRASPPTPHTMERIAVALHVPPGYLSGRAGLVDEILLEYIQNNAIIVEMLNEARLAKLPTRSWERLREVLREELRASTSAIGSSDPSEDRQSTSSCDWLKPDE